METRDNTVLEMRGETLGTISSQSSSEEIFQNRTLRPILKLQNDLFVQVFINYAIKQKRVFFSLTPEKKLVYIENVIQRDIKFRNSLKGMVIAFFYFRRIRRIHSEFLQFKQANDEYVD